MDFADPNYAYIYTITYHGKFIGKHMYHPYDGLVIYSMSGNNATLKIDFTDPRK